MSHKTLILGAFLPGKNNFKKNMEKFLSKKSNAVLLRELPPQSKITFGNDPGVYFPKKEKDKYDFMIVDELVNLSFEETQRLSAAMERRL